VKETQARGKLRENLAEATAVSKKLQAAGLCGELVSQWRFPDSKEPSWFVVPCLQPAGHARAGEDTHLAIFEVPLPGCCTTAPDSTCWCPRDCTCTCGKSRCYPCYNRRQEDRP
jgi:hypothetical protein